MGTCRQYGSWCAADGSGHTFRVSVLDVGICQRQCIRSISSLHSILRETENKHRVTGCSVNFDLGERFPRPAWPVAVLGLGAGGGRPLPLRGSGGVTPRNLFETFDAKFHVWAIWARK